MQTQGSQKKVLVVDDEKSIRESLQLILSRSYSVQIADSAQVALALLEGQDAPFVPDVVLLDVMMPGMDGVGLLERIKGEYPQLPVIMLTASTSVQSAVNAMKVGAVDYLSKPYDVDELLSLIENTLTDGPKNKSDSGVAPTLEHRRPNLPELPGDFGCIVGKSPLMRSLYAKIEQLAVRDTTILITGESGTGKEVVAKEIHKRSPRAEGPFIAINCAAIPESLIESELFGHEKGAFTHALERRIGQFELANGGTLFLDEIGELSLPVQVKILRFLQEQEFFRVGRSRPTRVDVRILAATNRSLETAMREGTFRQDLYYRINVVTLEMPPMRDRKEDIPDLVQHFAKRFAPLYGGKEVTFTDEAMALLRSYSWPGNVREVENVTESLLALSNESEITVNDLPHRLRQGPSSGDLKGDVLEGRMPFEEAERAFETEIILKALQKSDYVQTRAAELLGISRRILKYKMDKLGINDKPS